MASKDVRQIKVNNRGVGIIGLTGVLAEMETEYSQRSDDEVQKELLARLSKKNYIPPTARDEYGKAFLREFRKMLGQSYESHSPEGLVIKVVGPGCAQCDRLETLVMEALTELQLPADVEHVRDVKEIGRMGILGTPALMIGDKVMAVGSVPPKVKIIDWLKQAAKR